MSRNSSADVADEARGLNNGTRDEGSLEADDLGTADDEDRTALLPVTEKTSEGKPSSGCCSAAREYATLLRSNGAFRNMWLSMIVSGLGSWINEVATVVVLQRLSASTFAVAGFFVMRMLAIALMGPVAGVFIDRYDKSSILLVCDGVRVIIVLGYLLVQTPSMIWLVYVIIAAHSIFGAISRPCSQAIIPELVVPRLIPSANALNSLADSLPLAVGAALGGLVSAYAGSNAAYIIDSVSFLLSVFFVFLLRRNRHAAAAEVAREKEEAEREQAAAAPPKSAEQAVVEIEMTSPVMDAEAGGAGGDGTKVRGKDSGEESDKGDSDKAAAAAPPTKKPGKCAEMMAGIVYLFKFERGVLGVMLLAGLCRFAYSVGDLIMTKLSSGPFRMGFSDASFSYGLAYACAAVGVLTASLVRGGMMGHKSQKKLFTWIGGAALVLGASYTGASLTPWAWLYLICEGFVGAGMLVVWVQISNVLQQTAPAHLRGRIFSLLSLRYLMGATGFMLCSTMLDVFKWPIPLAQFVGATLPSIVMLLACIRYRFRAKT